MELKGITQLIHFKKVDHVKFLVYPYLSSTANIITLSIIGYQPLSGA